MSEKRPYDITCTVRVEATNVEEAKQVLQRKLNVNGFNPDEFRFVAINGAMYCPFCGRNEIRGVHWSSHYKGVVSVTLDGFDCCSEEEGSFPTEESAKVEIEAITARLQAQAHQSQ